MSRLKKNEISDQNREYLGFDIHGLDQNAKEDKEGIEKASKACKFKEI